MAFVEIAWMKAGEGFAREYRGGNCIVGVAVVFGGEGWSGNGVIWGISFEVE